MSYRKNAKPPTAEVMVKSFESAIKSLIARFRNHPYAFYTETDMHCYLYHRLYKPPFNELYQNAEKQSTILLHKEYPTTSRYSRESDRSLKTDENARRRGRFDISIWNPSFIEARAHRQQKVLFAAELALNECDTKSVHTLNDATKLADPGNEIKFGYLLYFVRDDPRFTRNEAKIRDELNQAKENVRVAIVRVDGKEKPKPEFLGNWTAFD